MIKLTQMTGPTGQLDSTYKAKCDCGCEFFVDSCGELNCVWDNTRKTLVACCPDCAALKED